MGRPPLPAPKPWKSQHPNSGARNQNNSFELGTKAINESHGIKEWVSRCGVGFELIDKLGETINILRNGAGLLNLEKLTDKSLVLITVKAGMECLTEGCPGGYGWCIVNGFIPARSSAFEVHGCDTNPHRRMNRVHVEVLFTVGTPKARILTIESVERKLG